MEPKGFDAVKYLEKEGFCDYNEAYGAYNELAINMKSTEITLDVLKKKIEERRQRDVTQKQDNEKSNAELDEINENLESWEKKIEESRQSIREYCSSQILLARVVAAEGDYKEAESIKEKIREIIKKNYLYEYFSPEDLSYIGFSNEILAYHYPDYQETLSPKR